MILPQGGRRQAAALLVYVSSTIKKVQSVPSKQIVRIVYAV